MKTGFKDLRKHTLKTLLFYVQWCVYFGWFDLGVGFVCLFFMCVVFFWGGGGGACLCLDGGGGGGAFINIKNRYYMPLCCLVCVDNRKKTWVNLFRLMAEFHFLKTTK